jgi:hypothetical protein
LIGCSVGFAGVRAVPPPRWLVLVALPVGICACLLARFLTHPCYNVNAVFRVQEGWGGMFPEHRMYLLTQGVAYALVFLLVPAVGRRKACLCEGAAS